MEFPKEALEQAERLSELQELLTNVSEQNFEDTKKKVLELPQIHTIDGIYQLVHEMFDIFELRVQSLNILARLVKQIIDQQNETNQLKEIKRVLLKSAFRPYGKPFLHKKMEALMFVRHCLKEGALTIEDIAVKIKQILDDCIFDTAENSLLYFFFGSEIEAFDPPLFTLLFQKTNRNDNPLESFIDTLDLLCANGWEKMHELTEYGALSDDPMYGCYFDDPSKLEKVDLNHKYENQFFQPAFLNERQANIAQIACFYGAEKCFNYLLEKGADPKGCEKYAVAGGNTNIINLLKSKGIDMLPTIKIAARFRRYEMFEELFNKCSFSGNDSTYEALNYDIPSTMDAIFSKCARLNNVKSMLYTLSHGAHPTKWNVHNMIFICAEEGHSGILKLLASIPEVEAPGVEKGTTALFAAAEGGHLGTLKALWNMRGADPSFRKGSKTMLHAAAANGHHDVVDYLIQSGAIDINSVDGNKRSPLFSAIDGCYISVIRTIINAPNVDVNLKDSEGMTALHYAAKNSPPGVLAYLTSVEKFNFNAKDKLGNTPFHYAACRETKHVAEQFKDVKNIDYTIKNKQGNTPLHLAAQTKSKAIQYVITIPSIDINAVNKDGQTPLHIAAKRNRLIAAVALTAATNIQVNVHDKKGKTPLRIASELGFIDIVKVLIKTPGIDPNDGNPLYAAAANGWPDVVIALLTAPGIKANEPGPDGQTALDIVTSVEAKAALKEFLKI